MKNNTFLLLSGPNLNMLGTREPNIYGTDTLQDIHQEMIDFAYSLGYELHVYQSNHEGDLIDRLQQSEEYQGVVFNPGAFMTYSYAIRDAIRSIKTPIVEVHLSNIYSRESWRHISVISPVVIGQISGFGKYSYKLGLEALIEYRKVSNLE